MRDWHKANTNNNHLTLEGFQRNLHYHLLLEGYQLNHLSLEGCHKARKVITLGGLSQPQANSFSQNNDPNR